MHQLLAARAPLFITRVPTTFATVAVAAASSSRLTAPRSLPSRTGRRSANAIDDHNANSLRARSINRISGNARTMTINAERSGKDQSYSVDAVFAASGGATHEDNSVAEAVANHNVKIILGSKSFTRKAILTEMGIAYDVVTADIDEKAIRREKPEDLVMALALAKADAIVSRLESEGWGGSGSGNGNGNRNRNGDGNGSGGVTVARERTLLITSDQVVVHQGRAGEVRGWKGGTGKT